MTISEFTCLSICGRALKFRFQSLCLKAHVQNCDFFALPVYFWFGSFVSQFTVCLIKMCPKKKKLDIASELFNYLRSMISQQILI